MKNNWLYWSPRILAILFTIFLSLFALDVFEEGITLEAIGGFFIHLIPSYLLIVATVIAWKEKTFRGINIGGLIFIFLGLLYISFSLIALKQYETNLSTILMRIIWSLEIALPAGVIGILFILDTFSRNKKTKRRR